MTEKELRELATEHYCESDDGDGTMVGIIMSFATSPEVAEWHRERVLDLKKGNPLLCSAIVDAIDDNSVLPTFRTITMFNDICNAIKNHIETKHK